MDQVPLTGLVTDLLSGDRCRQRAAVDSFVDEDVRFSHILGTLRGREAFYGIYRLAATVWRYKITWVEYIRSDNTVVLQLDLGIKVPPLYLVRYHFPTIVLLRFREGPDGKPRLVEQVDHHSMLALMWLLGWPFTAVSEMIIRPTQGFVFSRLGWALDALLDAKDSLLGTTQAAASELREAAAGMLEPAGAVFEGAMGKNGKLIKGLESHGISCIELPLIEHAPGPDREKLPGLLQQGGYDWVAVTSPEAAAVLIEGWEKAGKPQVRVAVVGGGTRDALIAAGVEPAFTASKAYGKIMGAELPHIPGGTDVVLYPASARASGDLQNSLEASGFSVNCIRTYDTVGVKSVDPELLQQAIDADAVTFGSPSAVKAWIALVGEAAAKKTVAVCIGSTSARACEAAGISRIFYPDSPGIQEWVETVREALGQAQGAPALR